MGEINFLYFSARSLNNCYRELNTWSMALCVTLHVCIHKHDKMCSLLNRLQVYGTQDQGHDGTVMPIPLKYTC